MTTPAAAALYEAQHVYAHDGIPVAVFNPHGKPLDQLPVIYGLNYGESPVWMSAIAIAEDGTVLGGHCCSSEAYMPADLGVLEGTRNDKHENQYRPHYPDGYRMEFVRGKDVLSHEGLCAAIEKNQEKERAEGRNK